MMKTRISAFRSAITVLAIAVIGGLAALVLQAASSSGSGGRPVAGSCQASLAVYEQALDRAERASAEIAGSEALAAARQKAWEDYADCLTLSGVSAMALEQTPPPTFARPPFTPPGLRGTPPPVHPPRGTPHMTPPMTPHRPVFTPPGPPPTRGRPGLTPPGPPITPPGRVMTPSHGPPRTPPGRMMTPHH